MRKYMDAYVVYETKDMSKEEWILKRKEAIGGSDAASVLGLNPYKSSLSVYLDKISGALNENVCSESLDRLNQRTTSHLTIKGTDKDDIGFEYDDKGNSAKNEEVSYRMQLGNKLEAFVANEFYLKTGKKVRNVNGILKNDKYPFAIANIDRAIVGEKAFLECKVTNSFSKKTWQKEVPIYYQIQCYHYMAVTGATHCYVAVLIGNEELVVHRLERNEEMIEEIMNLEKEFWEKCVLGDRLPMPDGCEDYSNMLKELYKDSVEETVIMFEKEDLINRYDDVKTLIKELDTEKKTIEQYIQMQMKDRDTAYIGERKITWKRQERKIFDSKRLKEDLPEIADQYMKTTTPRVFRI